MGKNVIGIRHEDKNKWERRIPFTPDDLQKIQEKYGIEFLVQTSPTRIYPDSEFTSRGIKVVENIDDASVVFAVKEIPVKFLQPDKTYIFFSHTIKGQDYNMPMLQHILKHNITLVDYERIVDDKNRRLVFFGAHAGYAGMIDSLHLLGQRHQTLGYQSKFSEIKMSYQYSSLSEAEAAIAEVGKTIRETGLPQREHPLVIGFAGYGNVSIGAQKILANLPVEEIQPENLIEFYHSADFNRNTVYKVVFKEEHLVERIDGSPFELQKYYNEPQLFKSKFQQYLPSLAVLVNCIYWTPDYPRLVTKAALKEGYESGILKNLEVIGDISIDIDGSVECSYKATQPDNPAYVYEPVTDCFIDGVKGNGPVILAVDNLPCEISKEASESFSTALTPLIDGIAMADWQLPFDELNVPVPIKKAVIAHQGQLTPEYEYIREFF